MKRRKFTVLTAVATTGALASPLLSPASAAAVSRTSRHGPASDPLAFDPSAPHTERTKTVTTEQGERLVVYRLYENIPYVADPLDTTYQSLNLAIPLAVDGRRVDASGAPILFLNRVGGYYPALPAAPEEFGSNGDLALTCGYVLALPGARGHTNQTAQGDYYGKAPAAIVDLKAAVRYLRHNRGRIPGNTDHIVATGVSAGGALTTLLGASTDHRDYASRLVALGAADSSDAIFAAAPFCPITDLEHADAMYEWTFGPVPRNATGELVDQTVSAELAGAFADYEASLRLRGSGRFGRLTADNIADYMVRRHFQPSATAHLRTLPAADRAAYLADHPWITWRHGRATFGWDDLRQHIGRLKDTPAFDQFDADSRENWLFGDEDTNARHFTLYSLRRATGDPAAELEADLPAKIDMMNPMHYLRGRRNPARPRHWWIRVGTRDSDTSPLVTTHLAARLENQGDDVNMRMYWDGGHGANWDPEAFMRWIGSLTGYRRH